MRIRISNVVFPLVGAIFAAKWGSVSFWDGSKSPLLVILSVIAAGVLVRLARGLPFSNHDQFEVEEARAVSRAVKQSIRALRALVAVVLATMGMLVFASGISARFMTALEKWPEAISYVDPTISAAVGFLITFVIIRIFSVVQGDVSLVDLQTEYLVRATERKQAERFENSKAAADSASFKNPEGYGKVIQ